MRALHRSTTFQARGLWLVALLSSAFLFSPPKPEKPIWVSGVKQAAFEPTACMDRSGHLWALWISTGRAKETTARIAGTVRLEGEAVADFVIEDTGLFPAAPHIAAWKSGTFVVWEAGGDDARQLFGRELALADSRDAVILGELETIPTETIRALVPKLAARKSSLTLVYQGLRGSDYELFVATRDSSGWSKSRALTETDTDEWNPRVAVDGADGLHIVWDFFDGESFDVAYARIEAEQLRDQRIVASGSAFQGYPELAVDAVGNVWIAWEASAQFGAHGGLRSGRGLGLAKLFRSDAPENSGALSLATLAPGTLTSDVSQRGFARPTLTQTGLLLTYNSPVRADRKRGHLFTSWMTSIVGFAGGRATEQRVPLTDGNGDPDSVLVADPAGGAWLVFSADRRREQFDQVSAWSDSIERRPHVAILRVNIESGYPQLRKSTPLPAAKSAQDSSRVERPAPRVYFGDLHRHSHLSRCAGAKDGTLLDAYRYARGPGALDFIAITDHFQHMKPWSWYRSKRDAIRYHAPGSLVVLSGIERVRAKRGHYNDIYFDPTEVPFDVDTWMRPPARFAPAPPEHVISIPHMMAVDDGTGFDWDEFDEERTRLFEIYQGKRGSYEGRGLPFEADDRVEEEVALARGFERGAHFGLIASSDHASSSTSFAGLYAEELTRESVFEALRNRRCYASTVARPLDASLANLKMGSSGELEQEPVFIVSVPKSSAAKVAYVELVKDGFTHQRLAGSGDVENWILSLRRVPQASRGLVTVEVAGGEFEGLRPRRPDARGARILSEEKHMLKLRRESFILIDFSLAIRWDPAAEEQSLTFRSADLQATVPRASLELGTSRSIKQSNLWVQAWRQGAALEHSSDEYSFRVSGEVGHSYYARIAWTDGNLAWTSPIRVRTNEEDL